MKVRKSNNYRDGICSLTTLVERVDKNGDNYYTVKFPRQIWFLFKNKSYKELVTKWNKNETVLTSKQETVEVRKIYKGVHSIPVYHIHRDNRKIGSVLLHYDKRDEPFLFIPRVKSNMYRPTLIAKSYYIFSNSLKSNLDIVDGADLWFQIQGRIFTP